MLRDVHAHADDVVLGEHVLIVAGGVLPLLEESISGLHRVLRGAVRAPLVPEVLTVVVGDVLSGIGRIATVELTRAEALVLRVMTEGITVRHVLAPRASIGGDRIGDNQFRQAGVRSIGVHLLNEKSFDNASLGVVVDLRPVNPVEATADGIRSGRSLTSRGGGLEGTLLRSLECGLCIGESSSQLGLTRGIQGGRRRVTRCRGGVARQEGVVFSSDAPFCARQGIAERVTAGSVPLREGGDNNEGCCDRGRSENHGRMCASELERH